MIDRLVLLRLVIFVLFAQAGSGALAQASTKLPSVGIITSVARVNDPCSEGRPRLCDFVRALAEKGWVDGRTVRLVWKSRGEMYEHVPRVMEELARVPVDVVVSNDNVDGWMWANAASSIPIVLASSDLPVENGLVASLGRPGGNLTGVATWADWTIEGKRIALLKEAFPGISKVGVLTWKRRAQLASATPLLAPVTIAAAQAIGLGLVALGANGPEDLEAAFERAVRLRAQGVMVRDYPPAASRDFQRKVGELAIKHRLPVIHSFYHAAEAGALLVYGHDLGGDWRKAASLVNGILRGAKAADLPFEQPAKLELLVNLEAARAIGLSVPQSVLVQASRISR